MKRNILVRATASVGLALMFGCQEPATDPVPGVTEPAKTPADTMNQLSGAYRQRNVEVIESLVDTATFKYMFSPGDVEAYPMLPPSWGWANEVLATRSLFQDAPTLVLSFDLSFGPATLSEPLDFVPKGWWKAFVGIETEAETIDVDGGENIICKINWGSVMFVRPPIDNDEGYWLITEWRDRDQGGAGPGGMGWGFAKYSFLHQKNWSCP